MHPKIFSIPVIVFCTFFFISCNSGVRVAIKDHHYSVTIPKHWKRMPDKERFETNIPVFAIADMVCTNEKDFNIPNKKDPKTSPTPNTVFVFFNFQKTNDCKKVYDSTCTSLSRAGEINEFGKRNPETFLGSLMRGVAYVNANNRMLVYMVQSPFQTLIAQFYLTDGVLEVKMYGHDVFTPELQKLQLKQFLQIIESIQIEPGKSCSMS